MWSIQQLHFWLSTQKELREEQKSTSNHKASATKRRRWSTALTAAVLRSSRSTGHRVQRARHSALKKTASRILCDVFSQKKKKKLLVYFTAIRTAEAALFAGVTKHFSALGRQHHS